VTRCYLDTNFLYAHLRAGPERSETMDAWRRRAITEMAGDRPVISALVVDELAYRLVLAWLRDDGESDPLSTFRRDPLDVMRAMRRRLRATWAAIDRLDTDLIATGSRVVDAAKKLMDQPGLTPRDAFHAGHATSAGCAVIVSADPAFDSVRGLSRLGP
jgi:predicted nucleic acid-binding protein